MPTTINYGFYTPPLTGVTPDIPRDTKTLADAVDLALKAEETARIAGDATVSSSRTQGTAQSFTSGSWAAITFNTMELDEIPWATDLWTVPTAGYYQINAGLMFASNSTGVRAVRIVVAGTVKAINQGSGTGTGVTLSRGLKLEAGHTVQIQGYQNSGGALALAVSAGANYGDVTRMGR